MEKYRNIPNWFIVIMFIFAWPIGFVLIVLKVLGNTNEQFEKVNSVKAAFINKEPEKLDKLKRKKKLFAILSVIQLIIALVFFIALLSDIVEESDNLEGAFLVNALTFGILTPLCITYFKTNKLIKKIETYQNLILIRDIYDTKKIAEYLGCTRREVLEFVSYMIREGYLDLDIENENVVKPKEYIDPAKVFSIVCQNCGANNKYIKGNNNKCEYCGSILNLNEI